MIGGIIITFFSYLWLALSVIFFIIEGITLGLTSIWFAIAAIVAIFASLLGFGPITQTFIFVGVSLILLYFTKPLVKDKLKLGTKKTNTQLLPGSEGIVLEEIPQSGTGLVFVNSQRWSARSENGITIPKDSKIEVLHLSGVTLTVKAKK